MFKPKIIDALKNYNTQLFYKDAVAGLIVGVVALPLAIAFAIASGVSPEKGIITAIIAGFIISLLGGSRVQIGGPTGAFIVIVYGVVQQYGLNGLIIATLMAGVLLILMGVAKLGNIIKLVPFPVIVGFTSGVAVIIFSSEMKDLFGLNMAQIPVGFIDKWIAYVQHIPTYNIYAAGVAFFTLQIIIFWPTVTMKIPGSLVAILVTTAAVYYFDLPVETIGSRFGEISASLPTPAFPQIDMTVLQNLVKPAITIALLGAIESLLSAVVADGMTGGNHRSNTELIAQGTANIFSSLFGGIPSTGAIARTATNIKSGAKTPVAGIVHAVTLLVILLFVGKLAALIPMATLGGILVVVAYNMSEMKNFVSVLKGSKSDAAVLVVTFLLTVLVDLTVAIEAGLVLATFLFMRKMIQQSGVKEIEAEAKDLDRNTLPGGVEIFELSGPLFFGAAYKFKDAMRLIEKPPKVLILRMKNVPVIDATGIHVLKEIIRDIEQKGTKLILAEVNNEQVLAELKRSRVLFMIGKANVVQSHSSAVKRSLEILKTVNHSRPNGVGTG